MRLAGLTTTLCSWDSAVIEFSLFGFFITPFSRDGEEALTVHNHKDLERAGVARPAMACLSISWQSPQHTPNMHMVNRIR